MKLTLGKKLGLGFGVILALMVVSGILSYVKSADIKQIQTQILQSRLPTMETAKDLQRDLNQAQSTGRKTILAGSDSARWESSKKNFDSAWDDIGKDVARLGELSSGWTLQLNRDRLSKTKDMLSSLRESQEGFMKQAASGERDAVGKAGNDFTDQSTVITEAIRKALGDLAATVDDLLQHDKEAAEAANRSLTVTIAVTTIVALPARPVACRSHHSAVAWGRHQDAPSFDSFQAARECASRGAPRALRAFLP